MLQIYWTKGQQTTNCTYFTTEHQIIHFQPFLLSSITLFGQDAIPHQRKCQSLVVVSSCWYEENCEDPFGDQHHSIPMLGKSLFSR
jgi:hypothetical protein